MASTPWNPFIIILRPPREEEVVESIGVSQLQLVREDLGVHKPRQLVQVCLGAVAHVLLQARVRRPPVWREQRADREQIDG